MPVLDECVGLVSSSGCSSSSRLSILVIDLGEVTVEQISGRNECSSWIYSSTSNPSLIFILIICFIEA